MTFPPLCKILAIPIYLSSLCLFSSSISMLVSFKKEFIKEVNFNPQIILFIKVYFLNFSFFLRAVAFAFSWRSKLDGC